MPIESPRDAKRTPPKIEVEKPRLPERITGKNDGFGVLKIVAGVIVALIVGSMVLFNVAGGRESSRGNKIPGEKCDNTMECTSGSICYAYKDYGMRCMKMCSKGKSCEPGFTCISATQQKRRKGVRVTDICVENVKL